MENKFIMAICLVLLLSCSGNKVEESKEIIHGVENEIKIDDSQFKMAKITLGTAQKRKLSSVLKLTGKIDVPPQNIVSVSMPLGGFLKSTKLLPGLRIHKGEVIATLEDQKYIQLQQEFLTTKSKLSFAENEYIRQKELNQNKATSDKVFQQTEMEYKTQKIALSALAEELRLINIQPENLSENNLSRSVNIISSIDGFVSKVNVNVGKYVNPSDILFELINPSDIHLKLNVFEMDLHKLSIGQKLVAFTNNQTEKKYPCEIILISQDISSERSTEVHCHFVEYDKNLFPGMYMNAEIELFNHTAVSINDEAILAFEGKEYVFVLKEKNLFELLEVKRGATENGFTEIHSVKGINLMERTIVTNGAYSLLMQLKNTPEEE